MRLSDLKRAGEAQTVQTTPKDGQKNGQKRPVRTVQTCPDYVGTAETRKVQVKSAVFPTEKRIFEALAKQRDKTLSDLIRNFLIEEARKEGLISSQSKSTT